MTRLTLDESLREKLQGLSGCIELCDPAGKTLGYFTPIGTLPPGLQLEPQVSEQELDRRERDPVTYSTSEVKAYLERL